MEQRRASSAGNCCEMGAADKGFCRPAFFLHLRWAKNASPPRPSCTRLLTCSRAKRVTQTTQRCRVSGAICRCRSEAVRARKILVAPTFPLNSRKTIPSHRRAFGQESRTEAPRHGPHEAGKGRQESNRLIHSFWMLSLCALSLQWGSYSDSCPLSQSEGEPTPLSPHLCALRVAPPPFHAP